jgi:hypothetical protein
LVARNIPIQILSSENVSPAATNTSKNTQSSVEISLDINNANVHKTSSIIEDSTKQQRQSPSCVYYYDNNENFLGY